MTPLRRIQVTRWSGTVLAVLFLSQLLGVGRSFFRAPTAPRYVALLLGVTLFLGLMGLLGVAVYAEERLRGRIPRPRPWLDRLSHRLFAVMNEGGTSARSRSPLVLPPAVPGPSPDTTSASFR